MRDASLDEFVDAGDGEVARGDDTDGGRPDEVDGTAGERSVDDGDDVATDAADVATVTYEWTPDGAACASCASVVEARWRDDEGLVCAECKDW